jgi:hypothetical protein
MSIVRNSRFAVSLIFAINGAVFGTWASRIPAISTIHDLSPAKKIKKPNEAGDKS